VRLDIPGAGGYIAIDIPEATAIGSGLFTASDKIKLDSFPRNVKSFGAVGNNIADDTSAIQAAIDASAIDGAPIVFPPGTYRITAALIFLRLLGVKIIGAGSQATSIVWAGGVGGTIWNISGCARCKFSGFNIQGSGDTTGILMNGILGTPNVVSTLNRFDDIFVSTGCSYGARIGTIAYQSDQSKWFNCQFFHCTTAGVSIEDANAVVHNFWDCTWQYCDAGITAILNGTGGSFNLFGCGFAGNGINQSAATSYDIAVYPSSRGCKINAWSEGSFRFLRTAAGSTATQVTLDECSVNGMTDSTGAGAGLGVGILWEASGGLNILGGKYNGTYKGVSSALQIQIGANNSKRANINIEATTFGDPPFQTTSCRFASIHLKNVQIGLAMDTTAPAATSGFLQRGTFGSPINFTVGNTLIYAPAGWLSIANGTVLAAGDNVFTVTSLNCEGLSAVLTDLVKSWGGLVAATAPLIRGNDAGSNQLQIILNMPAGGATLSSALVLRSSVNPEIVSAL